MSLKPILLADDLLDTSRSGLARSKLLRDFCEELACRLNSDLQVLYVDNINSYKIPTIEKKKLTLKKGKLLRFLQDRFSHCVAHVNVATRIGDPILCILREEQKKDYEFVVIGSRGNRGLKRAILGSVSEEVLRRSNDPVIVFGPEAQRLKYELNLEESLKILCLTDLTKASIPAEKFAVKLCQKLGGHLTLCYSAGDRMHELRENLISRGMKPSVRIFSKKNIKSHEKSLERKVSSIKRKLFSVEGLFLEQPGLLEDQAAKEAEGVYDLIVMGAHSRSPFLNSFIGSSTRGMILSSPVPVVVVRSPESE